jgi:hypothetical protein
MQAVEGADAHQDMFSTACDEYQRLKWVVTQEALDTYSSNTKSNWGKTDVICWKRSRDLLPEIGNFNKVDLIMQFPDGGTKVFYIHEFILCKVSGLYSSIIDFNGADSRKKLEIPPDVTTDER